MYNNLLIAVGAYKAIDHFVTSADARLNYKASEKNIEYLKEKDKQMLVNIDRQRLLYQQSALEDRYFQNEQNDKARKFAELEAERERCLQLELQDNEHRMRQKEIELQRDTLQSQETIARINAEVSYINANLDREARLRMHAEELSLQEQLETRRLRVQENISNQQRELQEYLYHQGVKDNRELERFKALASRETQILLARENAQNILNDNLVKQALNDFPLNISPLVLLKNRPHSLKSLLRFSSTLSNSTGLPDISVVYEDVKEYSENPEAINIFIAPLSISHSLENCENVRMQLWDSIYQSIESFCIANYNRNSKHPVILYPTAWRNGIDAGQHASETLHFFLKDMLCVVIEPRFDGHSLKVLMSSWNIGYISSDHFRTEMVFDMNLDAHLIMAAYKRSLKSLTIIKGLKELTPELERRKNDCIQNIKYYEQLDIKKRIEENDFEEIESLGAYHIFKIDPIRDTFETSQILASLIALNLAIISDVHHLHATDTTPVFPSIFEESFPILYKKKELRELTFHCYERVLLLLRSQDSKTAGINSRREVERVREMQILNLQKQLGLLDETTLMESIDDMVRKYANEAYGFSNINMDNLWEDVIEKMRIEDIHFFNELLPNITNRRLYKSIDKRIAELQR